MTYLTKTNHHTYSAQSSQVIEVDQVARIVSKTTLKKHVDERIKKRQLRCAKRILKDPLIFDI